MPSNHTVVVGNLTRDPETRILPDGTNLAEFTLAENKRRRDPSTGTWHDVRTTYWTVTCWRLLGIHVAGSLQQGDRVVVTGECYAEEWTGSDGQTRRTLKIDPTTVGIDLGRAPARVVRNGPSGPATRGVPAGQNGDAGTGGRSSADGVEDPELDEHPTDEEWAAARRDEELPVGAGIAPGSDG
ncbi:single-stranded DNA-binding protein [Pseudonocardia phyllosphaerae]|uniref:single-stranded DNA-binding protein n=1 Tax=Pseudonocardia phyllosphaerae TaxID=3390502 RepID=UPI00397CC3AB